VAIQSKTENKSVGYGLLRRFAPRNDGFTLAEVLITLVIIGIIAAITVPNMINNHNKIIWATQLKKTYSILSQGFSKMLFDDGVKSLDDVSLINHLSGNCSFLSHDDGCGYFYNNLKKYFNVLTIKNIENEKYSRILTSLGITNSNTIYDAVYFNDGSILLFQIYKPADNQGIDCETIKSAGGKLCKRTANIIVDVNGERGPNKIGRDLFWLVVGDDAHVYSYRGIDFSLFYRGNDSIYWKNSSGSAGCSGNTSDDIGWACSARIMENSWVIDY